MIRTQQVQPSLSMVDMHSQQAPIISAHLASPLVQVMLTPSLVMSHLHMPMVRLQQQTTMPFIMQHTEHIPPASIWQRFCIMVQAVVSSQLQVIFMPPWHFSTLKLQRGTITMFGAIVPVAAGIPEPPIPGIPVVGRSIIIVPVMIVTP